MDCMNNYGRIGLLPITSEEQNFFSEFMLADEVEKLQFIEAHTVETNVRLAQCYPEFSSFCMRPELNDFWGKTWCAFGIIISHQQNLPSVMFYSQLPEKSFNLVRGAFFYNASQVLAKETGVVFSQAEMTLIKMAINFGSVHAMQRYNQYCYYSMSNAIDDESEKKQLINIITNSKKMIENYGSYGYMTLGEALGNYAIWLQKKNYTDLAQSSFEAAETVYEHAKNIMEASIYSIHNASIGQGLGASNKMGFTDPDIAMVSLQEQFEARRSSIRLL